MHTQNRYKADLREIHFVLFEQFRVGELLGKAPFQEWGEAEIKMAIDEAYRFVCEVIGPLNAVGDEVGCRLENGQVLAPPGFKEAWKRLYENGWKSLAVDPKHGGQGAPIALALIVEEMLAGANAAFTMYSALTLGAAELVQEFGSEDQHRRFLQPMLDGRFGGTMCLTEPQAGSDVGLARTRA